MGEQPDPDTQGDERAAQLQPLEAVVGSPICDLAILLDVRGMGAERARQHRRVAHEHRRGDDGSIEPLVCVERDRVCTLDTTEERPKLVGEHDRAAVGGVDVEPCAHALGDVCERVERVDRPRPGRARRAHDRRGRDAGREIGGDESLEVVHSHREALVDRNLANGRLAEPEHVRGPIDREVRLLRGVDRELSATDPRRAGVPVGAVARELQRREVRERAARNEVAAGARR